MDPIRSGDKRHELNSLYQGKWIIQIIPTLVSCTGKHWYWSR